MAKETALAVKDVIRPVEDSIRKFQITGELQFPENYSPENALKSAALILQETKDKNGNPVLSTCTRASIINALLSMVVQGLNLGKKQGYFIAYGNTLVFQRSYFGSMALAKRVCPDIVDIYADVVYAGDGFEYEKKHGKTVVTKHTQRIENVKKDEIIAAYATVLYKDGREESTIMTIDEIYQAWRQSKMNPFDEKGKLKTTSTHGKFTAEMCKKTVINRACKPIINSSDDSTLVRFARQADEMATKAEVNEEIEENANKIPVDFSDYEEEESEQMDNESEESPTVDPDTGEVKEDTAEHLKQPEDKDPF
jgi:recombination protein RecT